MISLEEFFNGLPEQFKLWHFKYMFDIESTTVAYIGCNQDEEYPEEYGKTIEAILDEAIEKMDAVHDQYCPDGDEYDEYCSAGYHLNYLTKEFVQYGHRPTYKLNKLKNMDLIEWLRLRSDHELKLLQPYLSLEMLKELWKE